MMERRATFDTPTGPVTVTETDGAISAIRWGGHGADRSAVLDAAGVELAEYFAGARTAFNLPLAWPANPFRRRFLETLAAIPYGETRTYGDIAAGLGISPQAAGQACGANPIPIVIPCHRVLAATGLGGFSGGTGVETKVALLRLERAAGLLI